MKCLVTGASGFVGSHLLDSLLERGASVVALSRHVRTGAKWIECDLLDHAALARAVEQVRPGVIFHLGAQSLPGVSWDGPAQTFRTNVEGTLNLLDAARLTGVDAKLVIACSSAEYALAEDGTPIREDYPLQPSSPYGVSKLAVDHLARLYGKRHRLRIVRARPFFWIGPRKTGDFCSDVARRIVAAERSANPVVKVGALDAVRDFLDVRDGVRALLCLAERGQPGEAYNICSGHGHKLREILDQFNALARVRVTEETDPALLRPLDERVRIGDPSKLKALGWRPEIAIADSLRAILDYWRSAERARGKD